MSTGSPAAGTEPTAQFGTERAQQNSDGLSGQAQERAQQVAGQAQEQAQQAADQAKNRLREQLDQRSSQAAEKINEQASDFRAVGASLREQGKDGPASAADKLAEYAEKVGGYLRDRDSDALLADAEDYGRRQPWTVVAGGLALGFAASRFLKASSSRRYSERPSTQGSSSGSPSGQIPQAARPGMSPTPAGTPYQPTTGTPYQPTTTGTPYRPTTTYSAATDPAPVTPPDGSERVSGPVGTPPATPGI